MTKLIQMTIHYLWLWGAIILWITILIWVIYILIFVWRKFVIIKRLYSNLQRNILIVTPDNSSDYSMSRERRLLNNNLFKKVVHIDNYNDVSELSDYSLIILWYDENKESCESLITQIKNSDTSIPVIIYTYNKRIKDFKFVDAYIYHTFANTPVSLLETTYGIMSIYNNRVLWKR